MRSAVAARDAARCRDHDEVEIARDQNELAAVAPGIGGRHAGHIAHPPSIAIISAALSSGLDARRQRLVHPGFGDDLVTVGPALVEVQLAEGEHLPRRDLHVVAAEIDAVRVGWPCFYVQSQRLAEFVSRELQGRFAGSLGQDSG